VTALHLAGVVLPEGEHRDLWVRDGRITFDAVPGAETVSRGGWVLPGLVDAHCHVGRPSSSTVGPGALRCGDMAHRSTLAAVASTQLAAQLAGHVIALRRRRHFDAPFLTGSPDPLVRDWLWFGTAYSAPPYLVGPQIWAVARLLRGPDDRARWVLQWLGTGLTLGYLSERLVRARVTPGGWDPLETPFLVAGWSCAMAMGVIARR